MEEERKSTLSEDIFDWIESMAIAVFIVVMVFTFIFRIVQVDGRSMNPTLSDKDRIITTHLFYTPKFGDVVVCNSTGLDKAIVKRVIGVEGDTIDFDFENGIVYRNGEALDEPYVNTPTNNHDITASYPITVEEGKIFVMGDNRNDSTDSRFSIVGQIDVEEVVGKVIFRIFPFSDFGKIV